MCYMLHAIAVRKTRLDARCSVLPILLNLLPCWISIMLMLLCLETKHFIYFYIGSLAILIWKS